MGKSRADVVMVLEEELVGIEIKSDADTYARLSRQVKDYDRFLTEIMSLPVRNMLITWGTCTGVVGHYYGGRSGWCMRLLCTP